MPHLPYIPIPRPAFLQHRASSDGKLRMPNAPKQDILQQHSPSDHTEHPPSPPARPAIAARQSTDSAAAPTTPPPVDVSNLLCTTTSWEDIYLNKLSRSTRSLSITRETPANMEPRPGDPKQSDLTLSEVDSMSTIDSAIHAVAQNKASVSKLPTMDGKPAPPTTNSWGPKS